MIRTMTCIECPQGCQLTVDVDGQHVIRVAGNHCPKGAVYGQQEVENPKRTITSTVLANGLATPLVPVRTSRPIPKTKIAVAMQAIRQLRVDQPVRCQEILVHNFLGLDTDLIATRTVPRQETLHGKPLKPKKRR